MKAIALVLAIVFFVLGILYAMGILNFFSHHATGHHYKHMIVLWLLSFLCIIWLRFQNNK